MKKALFISTITALLMLATTACTKTATFFQDTLLGSWTNHYSASNYTTYTISNDIVTVGGPLASVVAVDADNNRVLIQFTGVGGYDAIDSNTYTQLYWTNYDATAGTIKFGQATNGNTNTWSASYEHLGSSYFSNRTDAEGAGVESVGMWTTFKKQ